MDPYSGRLYTQDEINLMRPKDAEKLVHISGPPEAINRISHAVHNLRLEEVRKKNRARNKRAKKSRKKNR